MSPVMRLCSRHRTLSIGKCPACSSYRRSYTATHVSGEAKRFSRAILARDNYTCHWCGGAADTMDYLVALVDGGHALDETNAVAACRSCNSRRGAYA